MAYFRKNRIQLYKKLLDVYSYNAIKRIQNKNIYDIDVMFSKYTYEVYFEKNFRRLCRIYNVRKNAYKYQECFDASQLAYMYCIHQCSIKELRHNEFYVWSYIRKVMRIYFVAALVIADDAKNLCEENDFRRLYDGDYRI